jgi:hypothetical protein
VLQVLQSFRYAIWRYANGRNAAVSESLAYYAI